MLFLFCNLLTVTNFIVKKSIDKWVIKCSFTPKNTFLSTSEYQILGLPKMFRNEISDNFMFQATYTLILNGMSIIFCAYTWSPMALRTCDLVVHSFTILSYHDLSSIGGLTLKDARTKEFKEGKKLQFMNRHLSFHNLRCDLKYIF